MPTELADGLALTREAHLADHRETRPKKLGSPLPGAAFRGLGGRHAIRKNGHPLRWTAVGRRRWCHRLAPSVAIAVRSDLSTAHRGVARVISMPVGKPSACLT